MKYCNYMKYCGYMKYCNCVKYHIRGTFDGDYYLGGLVIYIIMYTNSNYNMNISEATTSMSSCSPN